jgi:hypothetical protein
LKKLMNAPSSNLAGFDRVSRNVTQVHVKDEPAHLTCDNPNRSGCLAGKGGAEVFP